VSKEFITIRSFPNEIDASIMRDKLEEVGIYAFIAKDDGGSMHPHLQITRGVELKVAKEDFEHAREFLHFMDADSTQYEIEDDVIDEDTQEDEIILKINNLLRKSKAWVLIGFAVLPGWICHPVSFHYATEALKLYTDNGINIVTIKNRITRLRYISGFLSLLYWTATIFYVIWEK